MQRLSPAEMQEFLAHPGVKRIGSHAMTKSIFHWRYCAHCGLLALKNEATRKALRGPCIVYE